MERARSKSAPRRGGALDERDGVPAETDGQDGDWGTDRERAECRRGHDEESARAPPAEVAAKAKAKAAAEAAEYRRKAEAEAREG